MKTSDKVLTPVKAIRQKCLDCSGGSVKEVRECPIVECDLYMYRFGTNPSRQGIGKSREILQKSLVE